MKMETLWKTEELDFLKGNCSKMTCKEIGEKLNRTDRAVSAKKIELGLTNKSYNWTEAEYKMLVENYLTMTDGELSSLIGRTKNAVQLKIQKSGLIRPDKYNYNVNFFENIDTEDKAYWLGFIMADGYVVKSKTNAELGIELSVKDIEHLRKFNKSICGNVAVGAKKKDTSNSDFIKTNEVEMCSIRLYKSKVVNDLEKYGVVQKKTYTETTISSLIPNELVRDYIRGYWDGDGGCYFVGGRDKQLRYYIYGASKSMLENIRKVLFENNITSYITEDKRDLYKKTVPCYRLKIEGILNGLNFYDYIYKDSKIFLDRKYIYSTKHIEDYDIRERANKKYQRIASLSSNG